MLHFYGIFLPRLTIDLFWKTIYGTSPSDIKSNLEGCWSATICSPANLFRGNPLTKADLKQQNILCIYINICKKLCLLIWVPLHGNISRPCGELEVVSLTRAHHRGNHKQRNGDMELPRWGVDDVAPWDGFGFHGNFFLQ